MIFTLLHDMPNLLPLVHDRASFVHDIPNLVPDRAILVPDDAILNQHLKPNIAILVLERTQCCCLREQISCQRHK
jgi:hypothetical protein